MKWNSPTPEAGSLAPWSDEFEMVPSEYDAAFADFNLPLLDQEVLVVHAAKWRKPLLRPPNRWPWKKKK